MPIRIARSDLYERVWKQPLVAIAREIGISDVGLAKACRRAGIPLPPQGYWARRQHGKRVPKRPALPPIPAGQNEELVLSGASETPQREPLPDDIAERIAAEQAESKALAIPKDPSTWHTLVEKMRRRGPATYGYGDRRKAFTSTENRLHRVLNTLSREIEKRGGTVAEERSNYIARVAGERVEFSVTERLRQVKAPLTGYEKRSIFYEGKDHKNVNEPSGELRFRLLDYFDSQIRREWHDRTGHAQSTSQRRRI